MLTSFLGWPYELDSSWVQLSLEELHVSQQNIPKVRVSQRTTPNDHLQEGRESIENFAMEEAKCLWTPYTHLFFRDLISYCWYNPQPMRNDHSIAGTTILQTTLEDADSTQFYWWLDKSGGKGSRMDFKTFRCSTPSSFGSHETYFSFHGYRLTMVLNTETSWIPNYYLYHRIYLTINKIVYYQHLLVSFEELLSLRLSDHFALVVGCILPWLAFSISRRVS